MDDIEADVFAEGMEAGYCGLAPSDCPYPEYTANFDTWGDGFREAFCNLAAAGEIDHETASRITH